MNDLASIDSMLTVEDVAALCNVTIRSVWNSVEKGRLPAPVYPTSKTPRWSRREIETALEATRCLPREAMQARRMARIVTKAA